MENVVTCCDKHNPPLLLVLGAAEDQPCEHLAELVRSLPNPPTPVAVQKAMGEFLTTITPPDPSQRYATWVKDGKGRWWRVYATLSDEASRG